MRCRAFVLNRILEVSHAVTTPNRIVYIFKTDAGIESLSSWITFIHEQTHLRDSQFSGFLDGSRQKLLSDTLATEIAGHGETVDVKLATFCLCIHGRIIDAEANDSLLDKLSAQFLQLGTIVCHQDTGDDTSSFS